MQTENNGLFVQSATQFFCWLTATWSYLSGLSLSEWGVIIGIIMSAGFGLYGAWQQRKRTKLAQERTDILKSRYKG